MITSINCQIVWIPQPDPSRSSLKLEDHHHIPHGPGRFAEGTPEISTFGSLQLPGRPSIS